MSIEVLLRAVLIITLASFTSACGGGGGGSSDSSNDNNQAAEGNENNPVPEDNGGSEEEEAYEFSATQFEFLPLADGTSIQYSDSTTATISAVTSGDLSGKGVYAFTNNGTILYLSSTPTKIALHGIDGSIIIPSDFGNITVTKVRFYNTIGGDLGSVPLLYSTTPENTNITTDERTVTAQATTSAGTYTVSPLTVSAKFVNEELTGLTYGALPARKVSLSISGATTVFGFEVPLGFADEFYLASGIGIVKRNSSDYGITNEITGLQGLPTTVWFNNSSGTPSIADGSAATFTIAGGNAISSETYRIANQEQINSKGWISVQEDTASLTFNVTMAVHDDLPSTLTSVEIIFENKTTNERISGNVTIQTP